MEIFNSDYSKNFYKIIKKWKIMNGWTDGRMDGWTDGRMDGSLHKKINKWRETFDKKQWKHGHK